MARNKTGATEPRITGPASLSPDAITPDELHARIEAKHDAWIAAWRENPRPALDWAADKPNPGQRFVTEPIPGLHIFYADETLRSAA